MAFEQSAPSGGNPHLPGILFFGVCAAALAPFGLFGRRAIYPLVLAILSVATAMGYEIDGGPFVRLRDLPLFEGFRYPFRFLFPAGLFLLELGAFGGDALLSGLRRHVGAALPFALFLALVAGGLVQQWRNVDATIAGMPLAPVPRRVPNDFRQSRGSRRALLHYTAQNLGAIQCWEAYPVAMSPLLRGDLPQEEYFADPADGTVERRAWSPNRIALRVHAKRAARVLINQNWHPGWRASHGRVVSHEGLLAVDVPPGDHAVVVRYLPRSALGGALVSLAGLAGLLLVARRRAPTRRALVTSLLLPPMALLAALAIPEPPWPRPPLRNANRELIVLDALPREAIPVDVRFDLPVRIVGYEPPRAADPTETWPIRLYFHVEGDVPRSVGIFVHVITPRGRLVSLDHEVVGASVFLADAPKGKVLRDATAMLPGGPGGYRLRVGLWHASGDRSRIPIRDSGGLPTEDDWVELGVFGAPPR
ncbi:MAG: hypothetical protein H5U40_08855 [Polyangiaceae bacterium]|nr:hypothetical protein [Polyangiaceae bacterium]